MKYVTSAGGIIINSKGQVAIASQFGISWSFPKGHVEKGEDLITAARREVYEETGITELEYIEELGSYTRSVMGREHIVIKGLKKTIHFFLFKTNQKVLKPVDPDNPEARWVEKDEVLNYLRHDADKEFFESIITKIKV